MDGCEIPGSRTEMKPGNETRRLLGIYLGVESETGVSEQCEMEFSTMQGMAVFEPTWTHKLAMKK